MKKRILSLSLAFIVLCGLLPLSSVSVRAYSETDIAYPVEGGNIYFNKETGTITDCDEFVTCADIPAEIEGVAVTMIGWGAFFDCSELTSITIPANVDYIGDYAFYNCCNLASVTIPDSVISIGDSAFSSCSSLISLTIPKRVMSIGNHAFFDCKSLIEINVAEENPAYSSEDGVFFDKDKSRLFVYPAGKTETEYVIPDTVMSIDWGAFFDCINLMSVTIPYSVTNIESHAFFGCSYLREINVAEENDAYSSAKGVLFNKSKSILLTYPTGKTETEYVIPDDVTNIGDFSFCFCNSLTSVIISNGVMSIGECAFSNCGSLTNLAISHSVTSIGDWAFSDCTSLTGVTISGSTTSIGDRAFFNCSSLTSVYFMDDTPVLGENVFQMWDEEKQEYTNIPGLTLYYIEGKEGWTSPTWNGYPTATWIPAHEHSYADTVTTPTCTEKGFMTHTCSICGDSYIDTHVDALGHDFGEWTQTKAPTCTEKGEEKRTCSRCEAYEVRVVAATGHTAVIDKAVPATCTEAGKTEGKYCSVCNAVLIAQEEIPALGHEYENGVCVRCGEKDPNAQKPVEFADVPKNAWYVGAVEYAVQNGLMNGVGGDQFNPEGSMTRAMLVTVLWRFEGEPEAGKNTFSDVPNGQWYTDAVAWAAANGVVNGVGNNRFAPEGKITREQMATILYRYAEKKGIDTSKRAELGAFPDAKQVSAYAKDPVQWAVAEKIINGSDGKLLPQGDATRAQVATILMRFIENIVKE